MICLEEEVLNQRAAILSWLYWISIIVVFIVGLWVGNKGKIKENKHETK